MVFSPRRGATGDHEHWNNHGSGILHIDHVGHAWDNVQRLIEFCREGRLEKLAAAFEDYEDERKRQETAISNLEIQLTALGEKHREKIAEHGRLVGILRRADFDLETLIRTDEIFGESGAGDSEGTDAQRITLI